MAVGPQGIVLVPDDPQGGYSGGLGGQQGLQRRPGGQGDKHWDQEAGPGLDQASLSEALPWGFAGAPFPAPFL